VCASQSRVAEHQTHRARGVARASARRDDGVRARPTLVPRARAARAVAAGENASEKIYQTRVRRVRETAKRRARERRARAEARRGDGERRERRAARVR